ncbi:MAG TPA: urea ABC transporter ATP-binding subunit UrtE [Abditibacteriaceae bacterium]|jgi:urea transport system ATP-binding protein
MNNALLEINGLETGYNGSTVLRNLSLRVEPGQVVCLMGRNGVGKTTLLKSIMGLLRPQRGTLSFDGSDITKTTPDQRATAGIGYVPQGREIFSSLTVQQNLELGTEAQKRRAKLKKTNGKSDIGVPDLVYDTFPLLGKMLLRRGGDLSGGQQQQLSIGRALATKPSLLLLDEPMEGIQPSVVAEIEHGLEMIKKKREIAVLLVEQSLTFATRIADYYYVLDHGSVVAHGSSSEIDEEAMRKHLTV